ncbi:efflux RND transporter periplasmic adaptor subunit [Spirosoma radiotolerans]|uniref:RND transporter n=1 Tax=Spirosoma radiotolerans TaxID=1379870 RepID=A0A0E3ZVK5_9BACT|nr:efflux RND transporter periplasmic adaptor subunit [Spirosoma radiotolerans]AKD56189.1 RND transporter [Spirosoma radiotolerans]
MNFLLNSTHLLPRLVLFISVFVGTMACQSGGASDEEKTKTDEKSPTAKADSGDANAPSGPVVVALTQAQYDMAAIALGQPTLRPLSTTLKVNGAIDVPAQNMVSVSVPVGGYIRQIQLEPGMRIQKGQTLVVLENPEYIQLQQDYLDTKAKLEFADLEFTRQQELSRDNVNALKIFQQVRSNRQSLQAQLAGMGQRLAILRINPATLSPERMTRTITVPAPVSGYVTDVPVNNGRFVNPADVLVQITNVDHPHVRLNIFEKDISRIHTGQTVRFGMGSDAAPNRRGTIFLIGKAIATDRTISVLAHPEGTASDYIPGAYVSAQVDVKTQPLPALPEAAIIGYGGKSYVYVLDRKDAKTAVYHFRQIEVKTGVRENGYIAVTLPSDIDPQKTPIVVNGGYGLLAKLNNSEEE